MQDIERLLYLFAFGGRGTARAIASSKVAID